MSIIRQCKCKLTQVVYITSELMQFDWRGDIIIISRRIEYRFGVVMLSLDCDYEMVTWVSSLEIYLLLIEVLKLRDHANIHFSIPISINGGMNHYNNCSIFFTRYFGGYVFSTVWFLSK